MGRQARVIMLAVPVAVTLAVGAAVFAAEEGGGRIAPDDYGEQSRHIEELKREDARLEEEIKNQSDHLNIRINDIHETIAQHSTVLSILILAVIGLVGGLSVFFVIKHELNVRALRKTVEDEVKIIKNIKSEALGILQETKEYAEETSKRFDTLISDAKDKLARLIKETEKGKDDEQQKSIYEEGIEEDPSVKKDLGLLYSAAIKGEINDIKELKDISTALYYDKEYSKAINIHRRILDIDPDNPEVLNKLGWHLVITGDYAGAIQILNKAERIKPDIDVLYMNRARAYSHLKQKNNVLKDLEKVLERGAESVDNVRNDTDLIHFRNDHDFRALLEKYEN